MTTGLDEEVETDTAAPVIEVQAGKLDVVGGTALFLLAAWIWYGAADIDVTSSRGLGPAFFPRAIAVLLGGASLILVLQGFAPRLFGISSGAVVQVQRPLSVLGAIIVVILYASLIGRLTYYPATALFLPCMLWVAGLRRPLGIIACTIGFLIFTKVVFEIVLGTPLP